jgi:hypothetical protein
LAGRGPQTFKKRQKEQQRKEKQQEKLAKRLQRKQEKLTGQGDAGDDANPADFELDEESVGVPGPGGTENE